MVVPTMLTSIPGGDAVEHVEVLALGNLDPHIHFAILSDFVDADSRNCRVTCRSLPPQCWIERLNQRFGPDHANRFFCFIVSGVECAGTRLMGWSANAARSRS